MKKKLLALMLAVACVAGTLTTVTAVEQPVIAEAATRKSPTITAVYCAVKAAYGSNYLPCDRLSSSDIKSLYGISEDLYSSAIAELPMMNVQVDELVVVKAKNKSAKKKIKSALVKYRKNKIEAARHYVGLEKCLGSRVYVKGDYVCFICLGTIDNSISTGTDESKIVEAYKAETAKAVRAIKKLF